MNINISTGKWLPLFASCIFRADRLPCESEIEAKGSGLPLARPLIICSIYDISHINSKSKRYLC